MKYVSLTKATSANIKRMLVKHKNTSTGDCQQYDDYSHDGNTVWAHRGPGGGPGTMEYAVLLCDSTATAERLAYLLNLDLSS